MFKMLILMVFKYAKIQVNGPNAWDPQITDDRFYREVALRGSLGLGDSYLKGWWTCRDMSGFIYRLLDSGITDKVPRFDSLYMRMKDLIVDGQNPENAKQVAHAHYDTDPAFFEGVLGPTNSYTCARWMGVNNLEDAQIQKMDLLCRKAELSPGKKVLDIGCGWGGFLAHATSKYGVSGIGLSIAQHQIDFARERYNNSPIEFRLQDYRDFKGMVDSIVSICMIEHVGHKHYGEYFGMARRAIAETGVFALQCIVSKNESSANDAWIDKHIFPNGELVTLSRLQKSVKGLFHIVDQELFGPDYVKTIRAWYENLLANSREIVQQYGIEHLRKYEYYFQSCMGAFLSGRITVGQFVLSPHPRPDYVPIRI